MAYLRSLIALSAVVGASVIQHPLQDTASAGQALLNSNSKPLVNPKALEGHITSNNLLKRAKQLYAIAERGTKEYNHPTRVIGSEGGRISTTPTIDLDMLMHMLHRA